MQTLTQPTDTEITPATAAKIKAVQDALTLPNFKAWLQTHPLDEEIGIPLDCSACPIAKFLTEVAGARWISVSGYMIEDYDHSIIYFSSASSLRSKPANVPDVPQWVDQFIQAVDDLDSDVVTVLDALYILQQIERNQKRNQTVTALTA